MRPFSDRQRVCLSDPTDSSQSETSDWTGWRRGSTNSLRNTALGRVGLGCWRVGWVAGGVHRALLAGKRSSEVVSSCLFADCAGAGSAAGCPMLKTLRFMLTIVSTRRAGWRAFLSLLGRPRDGDNVVAQSRMEGGQSVWRRRRVFEPPESTRTLPAHLSQRSSVRHQVSHVPLPIPFVFFVLQAFDDEVERRSQSPPRRRQH